MTTCRGSDSWRVRKSGVHLLGRNLFSQPMSIVSLTYASAGDGMGAQQRSASIASAMQAVRPGLLRSRGMSAGDSNRSRNRSRDVQEER